MILGRSLRTEEELSSQRQPNLGMFPLRWSLMELSDSSNLKVEFLYEREGMHNQV